ncbi:MAG: hypothetical protein ABEN55_16770, partial [Bradymonadaceae bacterium]
MRIKRTTQEAVGGDEAPEELKERILAGMSEIDAEQQEADSEQMSGARRPLAALAAAVPLVMGVA